MTAQNEKSHVSREDAARTTRTNFTSNSVDDQRARLLAALHDRPMTTLEIRRELDILMPAARIFELRGAGKNILSTWSDEPTDGGRLHRVARYTLHPVRDLFSDEQSPPQH